MMKSAKTNHRRQVSKSPQQNQRRDCWQDNNDLAWTWMALYWTLGAYLGTTRGYLPPKAAVLTATTSWHDPHLAIAAVAAVIITLACQPLLLRRSGSFGRPPRGIAVLLFSVLNGVFETVLYLAVYDAGKWVAARYCRRTSSSSSWMTVTMGFVAYSVYAGLVHALFWQPHVFPQHILSRAPPFHTTMLPALIVMSVSWFVLYESTGDVAAVCALHALVDAFFAVHVGLQPPSPLYYGVVGPGMVWYRRGRR